jgi:hypothetical protein
MLSVTFFVMLNVLVLNVVIPSVVKINVVPPPPKKKSFLTLVPGDVLPVGAEPDCPRVRDDLLFVYPVADAVEDRSRNTWCSKRKLKLKKYIYHF